MSLKKFVLNMLVAALFFPGLILWLSGDLRKARGVADDATENAGDPDTFEDDRWARRAG